MCQLVPILIGNLTVCCLRTALANCFARPTYHLNKRARATGVAGIGFSISTPGISTKQIYAIQISRSCLMLRPQCIAAVGHKCSILTTEQVSNKDNYSKQFFRAVLAGLGKFSIALCHTNSTQESAKCILRTTVVKNY